MAKLFKAHPVDVMHVNNNVYEMAGVACWLVGIPTFCVHHFMPPDEPYWARRFLIKQTNRFYRHVIGVSNACISAWRCYAGCIRQDRSSFVWNGIDLEKFHPPESGKRSNGVWGYGGMGVEEVGAAEPQSGRSNRVSGYRGNGVTECRRGGTLGCVPYPALPAPHSPLQAPCSPLPAPRFQLISVGRLDPMKGFLDLVDAMAFLDDPTVKLWIVGEGEQRVELETAIVKGGLGDTCILLGHREDIVDLLHQADCFVLVSGSRESFGLALAEAMATGLPAITSDFGPLPEINLDGETGLVVPVGNPHALADAIRRLKTTPDLCLRMGDAAARRAQHCFGVDRMLDETLALFRSLPTTAQDA